MPRVAVKARQPWALWRNAIPKYIAIAHKLLADVAVCRDDLTGAAGLLNDALHELRATPAPLVEWKIQASLGRLHNQLGEYDAAREAFLHASTIIDSIAAGVDEIELRQGFLESPGVKEVLTFLN